MPAVGGGINTTGVGMIREADMPTDRNAVYVSYVFALPRLIQFGIYYRSDGRQRPEERKIVGRYFKRLIEWLSSHNRGLQGPGP